MATEGSRSSSSSVDSYIGSLISLTSKSEIRYEGILYNINTEESSIGLTNVRSFGTEGRKKDGLHVAASDKVYEYILFRGSDIKDLQVKSSQPVQPPQAINSDPAIIQSHYPRPPPPASNPPTVASDPLSTPSTYNPHLGQPGSTFQGRLPSYQPGGNVGPWGPSPLPPNTNSTGLAMPMYWPGYYAPPNPLQQSLPPPPQGLGIPPSLQQPMPQYPSFNHSLSTGQPTTSASSANSLLGSTLSSLPNIPQSAPAYTATTDVNVTVAPIKPNALSGASFPYASQPSGGAPLVPTGTSTPSLLTPGQLLQSAPGGGIVSAQPTPAVQNDVEVVQVSRVSSAPIDPPVPVPTEAPIPVSTESQPPILPLPPQTQIAQKSNGATYHNRSNYNYRGRERGRGSGGSRPVMKFTEEFDFNAMNEKFNKDEVWGTLGKTNRSGSKEKDENATDEDEPEEENDHNLPKFDVKPVYSKDDFFDTLSSSSSDRQSNYGRTRFSEQMKLDTETFGEFSRYRGGGRGGRGPYRGGRSRGGGYYGRGGGYGGYVGRGRGGRNPNAANDY